MAAVAAGAAIAGAGLSAYGAIQSAQDQADIDRQNAAVARQQASEMNQREMANDAIRAVDINARKLEFGSQFAASGHEGAGIGSQLEIQRQGDLQTMLADRDAEFQENMLIRTAKRYNDAADQTETAGYLSAASSILGGIGAAAGNPALRPNTTQTQSLPQPGSTGQGGYRP